MTDNIDRIIRETVDDMFLLEAGVMDRLKSGAKNAAYFTGKFGRVFKDLSLDKIGSAAAAGRIDAVAIGNHLKREFVRWANGSGKPVDEALLHDWMKKSFGESGSKILWTQASKIVQGKKPPTSNAKPAEQPKKDDAKAAPNPAAGAGSSNVPWASLDNNKTVKPPLPTSDAGRRVALIKAVYPKLFDARQKETAESAMTDAVRQLLNMVHNENLDGRQYVASFLAILRDDRNTPFLRSIIPVRESFRTRLHILEATELSARVLDQWFHAIGKVIIYNGLATVQRDTRGSRRNNAGKDIGVADAPVDDDPEQEKKETEKIDPKTLEKVNLLHDYPLLSVALTDSRLSEREFATMFVLANKAASFDEYEKTFGRITSEKLWGAVFSSMRANTNAPIHFDQSKIVQKVRDARIASPDRYVEIIKNAKDAKDFDSFRATMNSDPLLRQDSEASLFVLAQTATL
jgi:hypothetical protein